MSNPSPRYRTFEHTADIGIEIFGATPEELFENAAWGFLDTLTDASRVAGGESRIVTVRSANREELLVRWLSELLYLFATERRLFSRIRILNLSDSFLEARMEGEARDPDRHLIRHDIKAVTYHLVSIRNEGGEWKGRVIFDL
jgi:SHS2 domain-containing protein